jgi:hypothetical protein
MKGAQAVTVTIQNNDMCRAAAYLYQRPGSLVHIDLDDPVVARVNNQDARGRPGACTHCYRGEKLGISPNHRAGASMPNDIDSIKLRDGAVRHSARHASGQNTPRPNQRCAWDVNVEIPSTITHTDGTYSFGGCPAAMTMRPSEGKYTIAFRCRPDAHA